MITQKSMADMECSNDLLKNELNTLLSLLGSAKNRLAWQYTFDTVDDVVMRIKVRHDADLRVKVGNTMCAFQKLTAIKLTYSLVCYYPIKKGGSIVDFWGQNAAEGWLECREIVCLEDIVRETVFKLRELKPAKTIDPP